MLPKFVTARFQRVGVAGILVAALLVVSAPVVYAADDPFRFEGNGWGHGVGLSQYGAQARAVAGQDAEQIVTTYYTGTSVTDVLNLPLWFTDDEAPLWVGLLENMPRFDFESASGTLGLCQGFGPCPDPDIGAPVPGEFWSLRSTGTDTCQFYRDETPMGPEDSCYARIILGVDSSTRVTLNDKPATLLIPQGRTYAHGEIVIRPVTSTEFHVMVELSMEDYLLGIAEVPFAWEPAVLQAQALASRTYAGNRALAHGPQSDFSLKVKADCWCHVEDGASDQAYKGWEVESHPTHGVNWVTAVQVTAGKYITHPDSSFTESGLILALFSSSNGGVSETNVVAFGSSVQYPYLQNVLDGYSLVENPNAPWTGDERFVMSSTIADMLPELTQVDRIRILDRNASGSARTVIFEGKNGTTNASTTRSGQWTYGHLGLNSAWIDRVCRNRGPFTDDGCSFFEHNIVNIFNAGFLGTTPGSHYHPDSEMTRSDMAAFLAAGLGLPVASKDYFPDDDADPNHGAINSVAEAGIVKGYVDGTYRPGNAVTRAEMAVLLARALGVTLPASVPDPFPDVPGDSWFGPAVAEILSRGITLGHDDGTFKPTQVTTRGQMAAFLDRALLGGF